MSLQPKAWKGKSKKKNQLVRTQLHFKGKKS